MLSYRDKNTLRTVLANSAKSAMVILGTSDYAAIQYYRNGSWYFWIDDRLA